MTEFIVMKRTRAGPVYSRRAAELDGAPYGGVYEKRTDAKHRACLESRTNGVGFVVVEVGKARGYIRDFYEDGHKRPFPPGVPMFEKE